MVEHGFRLPSALDNRPLKFEEWEQKSGQTVFVSATPSDYELEQTHGEVVEQLIRPTGLLDPLVEVLPAHGQVNHLVGEIRKRAEKDERVLVTALTKRLAEDLSSYFQEQGLRCRWLHSELNAFERVDLLKELREGKFDVLVGVNLLREGLDLPEVSLVAILDADKEGFLRSETSLIQTIGRAARNANAQVILYADKITRSMRLAIDETARRREIQQAYNLEHGITPKTVKRNIGSGIDAAAKQHRATTAAAQEPGEGKYVTLEYIAELEGEMLTAAEELEFERAAALRDRIDSLKGQVGKPLIETAPAEEKSGRGRRKKVAGRRSVPRPKKA